MSTSSINAAVIIVNYNSQQYLVKCLAALRAQTIAPAKIIVLDNGGEIRLSHDFEKEYPEITVIRSDKNHGFAKANNIAAMSANECEWIITLNPDAYPASNWLETLSEAIRHYPDYHFFGCHMLSAEDPNIIDGTGDIYHVSGRAWRREHGCRTHYSSNQVEEIFAPCAAAAMYKREIFLALGGFDEQYFCYFEDVDLGFRLRLAGEKCLYLPQAIVYHVGSAVTGKHSDFYVYYGQRNIVWTYIKNMPSFLFWLYLPQHIILNLISIVWFIFQGKTKVILKSKLDALRALPKIWQQRKIIQTHRRAKALDLRKLMAKGLFLKRKKYA